jgi:hypothetical protein
VRLSPSGSVAPCAAKEKFVTAAMPVAVGDAVTVAALGA